MPAFEVAAIKPDKDTDVMVRVGWFSPGTFTATGATVQSFILFRWSLLPESRTVRILATLVLQRPEYLRLGRQSWIALRHSAMTTTIFLLAAAVGLCQVKTDTAPRLEFDVASIKPSKPGADGGGIKPLPGGQTYIARNVPVKLMIKLMFHLTDREISGGPAWLDTDLYDVEAKADRPRSLDELHVMFQNLLVDRFKLQFHKETRILPAYELVVDKSEAKLTENKSPEHFDIPVRPTGFGKLEATHCSMSYFTWILSQRLDRPVIDQTGLTQFYDFKLEWTPELPPGLAARPDAAANLPPTNGPDIFTAVREQLGLKLDSHKGPIEIMIIDHVERPSEN
jgi:uncharacterized protein (TIGR03435 family)